MRGKVGFIMGLVKGNNNTSGQSKEYCADMTNNKLYVDGVEYTPYEVTNIMDMKHAYYHVPESVHTDLQNPYRFSIFILYAVTDDITTAFYKPTSMIISNGGIIIEDTNNDYCVVIDKA